jgi:hypothetical protein
MEVLLSAVLLAHWLYSDECCGGNECHPVACAEVIPFKDGWHWHNIMFAKNVLKISPDGSCHVCVQSGAFIGHCIYMPPQS